MVICPGCGKESVQFIYNCPKCGYQGCQFCCPYACINCKTPRSKMIRE